MLNTRLVSVAADGEKVDCLAFHDRRGVGGVGTDGGMRIPELDYVEGVYEVFYGLGFCVVPFICMLLPRFSRGQPHL